MLVLLNNTKGYFLWMLWRPNHLGRIAPDLLHLIELPDHGRPIRRLREFSCQAQAGDAHQDLAETLGKK